MCRFLKMLMCMMSCLVLAACVTPAYHDHSAVPNPASKLDPKNINFRLSDAYLNFLPACVFVLPGSLSKTPEMAQHADQAFARHLGEKIERVIFPKRVDQTAAQNGYDLNRDQDLKRLGRHFNCDSYAKATLYDLGHEFALLYSQKYVGLKLDLFHLNHPRPLWEASHTVWRGEGGLALSPIGALGGIAQAAIFDQNEEILLSLTDDAVRRMIRTLPATY